MDEPKTSLLSAAKPAGRLPLAITLAGEPGTGKTTLASMFPSPFMIQTLGESVPRDVPEDKRPAQLGVTEKPEQLWDQLKALINEQHDFKTLITDSVTGLEAMFIGDVLAREPKAGSINRAMGGYGAGRDFVASQHARFRRGCEVLRSRKGMNIVFLAHADITRIDPPDSEGYNRYSLRLHEKSLKSYVDDVDLVGFLKQETLLRGSEGEKRAFTTNQINMIAHLTPEYTSKNRLGITEEIPVSKGENPLLQYL